MRRICKLRHMFVFALTIFLGAFLLFQVQPLIGKFILPWFGGGPGVWTTCMLFFQVLLLGGYAYAHFSARWLKPRSQVLLHLALLVVALLLLPITPGENWKPKGDGNPAVQILLLLTACLGLPYFVLSSTGPLVQHWFSRAKPGVSPYRLYALSNVGSLLALVSYPFLFEAHFTRKAQALLWAVGFGGYVMGCAYCALKLWKLDSTTGSGSDKKDASAEIRPSVLVRLLWLLLPACASVLLLAVTNKLCIDVAVIPFLWVLPLAVYLLTFIIAFDSPRWYLRFAFTFALIAALGGLCWMLFNGSDLPIKWQIVVYLVSLFVCCMVCHGELYRLRPHPSQLTGYYLMISAGGALGGCFVALVAPTYLTDYYELHWGLLACGILFVIACIRDKEGYSQRVWRWLACLLMVVTLVGLDFGMAALIERDPAAAATFKSMRMWIWVLIALLIGLWALRGRFRVFKAWRFFAGLWLCIEVVGLAVALHLHYESADKQITYRSRNFYGTLKVAAYNADDPLSHYLLLQHGRITHGIQFLDPTQSKIPTTYYSRDSGIGLAMRALPAGGRRMGLVGLGTGTLAAYGEAGDYLRIYEINPEVERIAKTEFTYLSNCPAKVDIVLGDARLSLERETAENFDLLVLDAFSSDSIPVHLLTAEAFQLYERHVKTNGIIAVHVSNHYLNLEPVVENVAKQFKYRLATIEFEGGDEEDEESEWWAYNSTWMLLTHDPKLFEAPAIHNATIPPKTNGVAIRLWTDDFASLFQILQ